MNVTPKAPVVNSDGSITEEKVEYRDENGVLLNEEQVKALEGKVSFSTRYETRTRLVDEHGNEIYNGEAEQADGSSGTFADAPEPGTAGRDAGEGEASTPAHNDAAGDLAKEKSVEDVKPTAEPESEAAQATKDEL